MSASRVKEEGARTNSKKYKELFKVKHFKVKLKTQMTLND